MTYNVFGETLNLALSIDVKFLRFGFKVHSFRTSAYRQVPPPRRQQKLKQLSATSSKR